MIKVPDEASYAAMLFLHKLMAKRAGPSTGTNLWGAFELIADMTAAGEEGSIVSLICDSGERYSQTFYDDVWLARKKIDLRRWRRQLQTFVETGEWLERQPRAWREPEEAILPVRMKLEAQMENSATARSVAGAARSAAKNFPQSELVMEVLAQAELQGKRYEEASTAADRALALNPKAFKPLIYKGRARMEIAKQDPKSADWKAIRAWFAKANRQDLNSPEPLMYYYQTFLEEGVTPPAQAVDGLLFAVELVPQDDDLRLMAVRQLVRDGDLANAKDLFAPIAYSPHFPKEKRRNLEIMDKLKAGDGKAALAMLDEDEKRRQKAKR